MGLYLQAWSQFKLFYINTIYNRKFVSKTSLFPATCQATGIYLGGVSNGHGHPQPMSTALLYKVKISKGVSRHPLCSWQKPCQPL